MIISTNKRDRVRPYKYYSDPGFHCHALEFAHKVDTLTMLLEASRRSLNAVTYDCRMLQSCRQVHSELRFGSCDNYSHEPMINVIKGISEGC